MEMLAGRGGHVSIWHLRYFLAFLLLWRSHHTIKYMCRNDSHTSSAGLTSYHVNPNFTQS